MELSQMFQSRVNTTAVVVGLTTFVGSAWLFRKWRYQSKYKLPTGPPATLFAGNYGLFDGNPLCCETLKELTEKHGDIISLRLGIYDAVLLNSYDAVQEMLGERADRFRDRPSLLAFRLIMGNKGVLNNSGTVWAQLRRFTITALRDLGMGKKTMEDYIEREAEILAEHVDKHADRSVDMSDIISSAVSNIVCHLIFNTHYDYDDEEFVYFTKRWDTFFQMGGLQNSKEAFMPYLIPFALFKGRTMKMAKLTSELRQFIQEKINQHYENYDPENIRDFVDMYIQFDKNSTENREGVDYSQENLFAVIFDLFMAGTETTNTTLKWAILHLMRHPEVQARCRQEIQRVIGNRPPAYSERDKLPYTLATIMEIQRLASIVPLIMHGATCDVNVREYHLPKETIVFGNLFAANRDPKYFADPDTFDPTRWLNEDGGFHVPISPIVFGGGPRVCLGETLAKYEIFLFLTTLIQRFEFSVDDPENPPSMQGLMGITMYTRPYKVSIKRA